MAENFDLRTITTPINVPVFEAMLKESGYPAEKTKFLVQGFTEGFNLGYEGETSRADLSDNLPLNVGSDIDLWNKIMKEVKAGRFVGPYKTIPFSNYIQSPIGLVPKAGNQTRLIFHLSYDFKNGKGSVNSNTPEHLCKVKYKDLDYAVRASLYMIENSQIFKDRSKSVNNLKRVLFYSKSDLKSAFRILPLSRASYRWLLMKAKHPLTKELFFFADKNLPFGASISCSLFTDFSEALRHLTEYKIGRQLVVTNYLDDFLFTAETSELCDDMVRRFLHLCNEIRCPVSLDKTEWSNDKMIFLGILLDGASHRLCVPIEKRDKALNMLFWVLEKKSATVRELQSLSGFLNFLNKAIVPGRAFTRRMYAAFSFENLKPHYHVRLTKEFKDDCRMWVNFLSNHKIESICRPYSDLSETIQSTQIQFYTDASGRIGYGCSFGDFWIQGFWPKSFLFNKQPSIQFLELYALCVGLLAWGHELTNATYEIFCDNKSVRDMVNHTTSGCRNCMVLIRIITINNLIFNRKLRVKYIETYNNQLADSLSRGDLAKFRNLKPSANPVGDPTPSCLWPIEKIWID